MLEPRETFWGAALLSRNPNRETMEVRSLDHFFVGGRAACKATILPAMHGPRRRTWHRAPRPGACLKCVAAWRAGVNVPEAPA